MGFLFLLLKGDTVAMSLQSIAQERGDGDGGRGTQGIPWALLDHVPLSPGSGLEISRCRGIRSKQGDRDSNSLGWSVLELGVG